MKTLTLILLIVASLSVSAQNEEIQLPKFGKVTEQDFRHTPQEDLGYDAVILINEKSMYFEIYNGQLRLFNQYRLRIKALKDDFNDPAIFTIRYSGRYEYEKILSPRCWVFHKNGNKIDVKKTKYKNITYIDRDSLESSAIITPPAIHKGDIVDIEYHIITFDFTMPPIWKFSAKYPCALSRLSGTFPHFMQYKYDTKGLLADCIVHEEDNGCYVSLNYAYSSSDNPKSLNYMSGIPRRINFIYKFGADYNSYTMTNVTPEDAHEPQEVNLLYGTAAIRMRAARFTQEIGYANYHFYAWQQLTHLLYTYADPDNRYLSQNEAWHRPYNPGYVLVSSNNWEKLFKRQKKSSQFWKAMLKAIDIPYELKSLSDPDEPLDTLAAAQKIYHYAVQHLTWDSTCSNHTNHSIANILKKQRGSNAETNMALVSMLRRTGIDALAVLASTTGYGEVDTAYANTLQFDAVLACVPYENRLILLDVTDPQKRFGTITPGRYDRVMWFLSPSDHFFGEASIIDDKQYNIKKLLENM
ncbi:MAG: transglutaminase-like domain-containing protein [Bacteroidales bacterium]|nr:transglutaminase-like domain-containing protein [Bacteroidales bacterium]